MKKINETTKYEFLGHQIKTICYVEKKVEKTFPEMKYTMDQPFTVKKPSKDPPINIKKSTTNQRK